MPDKGLAKSAGRLIAAFVGGAEIIFPVPLIEKANNVRLSLFLDAGNVYGINEDIDFGKIRYSVGLGANGLIRHDDFILASASIP